MVRSTSLPRPISGSILPSRACSLRLTQNTSSGLFSVAAPSSLFSSAAGSSPWLSPGTLEMPCDTKFTTSKRLMFCLRKKWTACDSFSPKMAISTLAPVTSFLPTPWTCSTARWITRWKPMVGWVSILLPGASMGTFSSRKALRLRRSSSMLPPHARNTRAADGLSSSAARRCSTVMNSWRCSRAFWNALFSENSSSCDNMPPPPGTGPSSEIIQLFSCEKLPLFRFQGALQRVLLLLSEIQPLPHLGFRNFPGINPANPDTFLVHLQHDAGCILAVLGEKPLQNDHHELHRSIVVVQQDDFVKLRLLELGLCFLNDGTVEVVLGVIAL